MSHHTTRASPHILIIEDETDLSGILADYVQAEGWQATVSADGEQALALFKTHAFDVLVLDLMLPGLDGISLCKVVRAFSDVPIIMTTAKVTEIDRLLGLEVGADDYLCKPFSPRELMARIKVQLRHRQRRQGHVENNETTGLRVEDATRRAHLNGHLLDLTPSEFDLLAIMAKRPGQIYSRAQLLDTLRRDNFDITDRAIDSHIKNLRKKIAVIAPDQDIIQSVYGVGYRVEI